MSLEKIYFLQRVTVLYDTREKDEEFLQTLLSPGLGLRLKRETFTTGDYSYEIDGISRKPNWVAERKGSLNEIYGNVMAANKDKQAAERNNLEEEFRRAQENNTALTLFVQGARSLSEIRHYINARAKTAGLRAGQHIYNTLLSWSDRYGIRVIIALTAQEIAEIMVDCMYFHWRNEMKRQHGEKFLKVLMGRGNER